jgi:hypothetical protein
MSRRLVVLTALAAALLGTGAAPAFAALPVDLPDPTDCHEVNDFLGIDNVRDCSGWPFS